VLGQECGYNGCDGLLFVVVNCVRSRRWMLGFDGSLDLIMGICDHIQQLRCFRNPSFSGDYLCSCVCVCVCIYTYTHTHTHIYTYILIYTLCTIQCTSAVCQINKDMQ
jgi:hypothetical protein